MQLSFTGRLSAETPIRTGSLLERPRQITTTDYKLKFEIFARNLFYFNIHYLYCNEPKEFF